MKINWNIITMIIFSILVGYSIAVVADYHDDKVLFDYINEINDKCYENTTEKIPLYREITDTGINLTILVENNFTYVEASLI